MRLLAEEVWFLRNHWMLWSGYSRIIISDSFPMNYKVHYFPVLIMLGKVSLLIVEELPLLLYGVILRFPEAGIESQIL